MALARSTNYSASSGGSVYAGIYEPPFTMAPQGVWTWFNTPVAQFYNGATYVGYVKNNGRPGVSKYTHSSGTAQHFELTGTFENDDHDNAAVLIQPDGRIVMVYSLHSDYSGFRWRISTNPEDITAFGTEQTYNPTGSYSSYVNVFRLSSTGLYYNWFRDGGAPRRIVSSSDLSTWTAQRSFITSGVLGDKNCYSKMHSNGVDRVHILFVDFPPYSGNTPAPASLFHGYMETTGAPGVENFYNSAGTLLGTNGSLTNLTATKIAEGYIDPVTTGAPFWTWDITVGSDGHPCALFVGFADVADHTYLYARWTGSAWVVSKITQGGPGLYAGNDFYSGGLCFDSMDPAKVYLSKKVGTAWEIQEWRTADNGATWAKYRDITTGSASGSKNCRPMSPLGHDGRAACVWWSGTYTSFYNWATSVQAIAASA